MDTPRQRRSSRSRASYCSMSTSLMSIQEEDESLAISPSPMVTRNTQSHYNDYSSTAIVSAANPAKRVSRKSVSFGPVLSPEVFNKRLPPSTPVRAGKAPGGLRRSLPANFAMPQAVSEEEDEQDGEGEGEMVDYTMTGFEESCSESSSSDDEDTEMEEEEESEIEEEMVDTPVASPMQQATPVVRAVHSSFSSQPRYKKLPTPLRRAIQEKPRLRVSRRSARTSLGRGTPRRLHRSLTTPIRTAIHSRTALRKTRRALHTPLRRAIEDMPALRKTKRSMPTPLRREIEGSVELRKTKSYKTLVTPVRREIEGRPTLRKTKKSMPTPVRLQIEERPGLRKTKKSMPTPVRRGIESRPTLRKTKPTLPTPIREDIKNRPQLRKTKKSIPTPLKRAIKAGHVLRKTKRTLPTPLRTAIQQCPPLRATKKSLPRDLLDEIASRPTLHPTKKSMPTPLREEIQRGVTLRAVSTAAPSRPKRKHADTVLACETPVPMPSAKRRKVANTPLPYNADPGSITATDTPQAPTTKRSKRDYATTVTPSETPVPAPPTKRARVAASPAQNTPLPYNFIPFAGESSPAVDLTGLPRLFKSPCICNSADPADAFEVRLFGGSREVSFASPLACSAKKPTSRPNSAQALHSCLRSSGPPLFTIGTAKPLQQNGGQDKRTRKRTRAATTTCIRVTRSSAPKQNTPCNDPPVRTRGRSANNNDKENISLPVVRSTRSRAATTNQSELKSVQMQLAVTPLPARRSTRMSMRKEAPPSTESEGPKSRATAEGVSTRTCTKKSRSNEEKQIISTQPPQQTADTAKPSTRSRGQAKKSAPAATAETTGRSLRHSRRLVPAPQEQQQQAEKKVKESKTSEAPVTQTTGGRRTRQTVKKAPAAVEEEATTSRRPTPSVSYQETTSVPVRRSARLKK